MSTEQQAFPVVVDGYLHEGMTLRDYFAAKAMQGLLINGNVKGIDLIKQSYQIAEAMMKSRGETK